MSIAKHLVITFSTAVLTPQKAVLTPGKKISATLLLNHKSEMFPNPGIKFR